MKYNIYSIAIIGLIISSCIKDPVACIDVSSTEIEVFDHITLNNCSEESEVYEWVIEDEFNRYETSENSPVFYWNELGVYSVKLTAYSKKQKKSDEATETITVVDVCYTCIREHSFGSDTSVICGSEAHNALDFENQRASLEANDYVCTKNP